MTTANPEGLGHVRFCDKCIYPGDGGFLFGTVAQDVACFRCGNMAGIHVLDPKVNNPRLSGFFPAQFSTCVEVLRFPLVIWDTNRYYADLGISPSATRKEIREAYVRRNGSHSARLTYITKQLLNPDVRVRYDSTPFGSIFRDEEVETWIRRAKAAMVREYLMAREEVPDELLEDGEVPDEMVLDTPDEEIDNAVAESLRRHRWPYGFYVWQSPVEDEERLAKWQVALATALCRRGEHRKLAVGFQGAVDDPWVVTQVGYLTVVFLSFREWPNDELAEQAVSHLLH